jgi:hypothetical protein
VIQPYYTKQSEPPFTNTIWEKGFLNLLILKKQFYHMDTNISTKKHNTLPAAPLRCSQNTDHTWSIKGSKGGKKLLPQSRIRHIQ